MPDWITHVLIAWTLTTILGFRFKQFNQPNSAIVILGALIPDIYKIYLLVDTVGLQLIHIPFHLPVFSLLLGGLITLFFERKKQIFSLLTLGIFTHYALDILLFNGGIAILYPFSPIKWQIGIISVTDYNITIISIIVSIIVYFIYTKNNNTK